MSEHFPILRDKHLSSIPWSVIREHEAQAQKNHYQSLGRLAQRGGLSCSEAVAVIENRPWRKLDDNYARLKLCRLIFDGAQAAATTPPASPMKDEAAVTTSISESPSHDR